MQNEIREKFNLHIYYHLLNEFGNYVFEKNGTFDNFKNICEFISKQILVNNNYEIDCTSFDTFFDKIYVNYNEGRGLFGAYDKYENNNVYIDLNLPKDFDNFFDIENIILHELLHAYEDYNRKLNNNKSLNYYLSKSHIKAQLNLNSRDEIISNLSKCQYFLNDKERRAYFGTLKNTIINIIKDNKISLSNLNYKFIVSEIFKSGIWKQYEIIHNFINVINDLSNDEKKLFTTVYNSMNKSNITFNNIVKEFKIKWKKFDSKFNQLVPKIICDNINIDRGF